MAFVTEAFEKIWYSGDFIGENTPKAVVQVQLGHYVRAWDTWDGPPVNASVWGEGNYGPDNAQSGHWFPTWHANTPWYDVPNLQSIKRTKDFQAKGVQVVEITLDAMDYVPKVGALGDSYHAIAPGWLAPGRNYVSPMRGRPSWQEPGELSEWAPDGGDPRISDSVKIRVWQGFGDPETDGDDNTPPIDGGTNGAWVFNGLIDDVDIDGDPNTITITARNGKLLTDQRVFRASKSVQMKDPITFYDRDAARCEARVGYAASASSSATKHSYGDVLDHAGDAFNPDADAYQTSWQSGNDIDGAHLEWVEIRLPEGTYESFWMVSDINQLAYVGIYARKLVRYERKWLSVQQEIEPPRMDGEPIDEGWVDLGHTAPGGGWPYVRAFNTGTTYPEGQRGGHDNRRVLDNPQLGHIFELGERSILRLGFLRKKDAGPAIVYDLHGLRRFGIQKDVKRQQFILVDDATEIVKVVLRWAGYREWEVEDAMVRLSDGTNYGPGVIAKSSGRLVFNRSQYLIDIIAELEKQLGWVFFIADPTDANSEGVPTFRRDASLVEDDGYIAARIDEDTMLTGLKVKRTDEDRPFIIRVRGKTASVRGGGFPLGGDTVLRLMALYVPPWAAGGTNSRTAGILRHIVYQDDQIVSFAQCLYGCLLIAMNAALAMHTAVAEIPSNPLIELDDQVGITDEATGTNSRMWVIKTTDTMTLGENATWKMTLEGSLLDTRDLQEVIAQVKGKAPATFGSANRYHKPQIINWRHVVNPDTGRASGTTSPMTKPGHFTQKRIR